MLAVKPGYPTARPKIKDKKRTKNEKTAEHNSLVFHSFYLFGCYHFLMNKDIYVSPVQYSPRRQSGWVLVDCGGNDLWRRTR